MQDNTPHRHHHHHHHTHSHQQQPQQSGSKKQRIEDLPRKIKERQAESFFAKNFLKIAGIIFILAAIWFSISSIGPLKDTLKSVVSKEFFQVNERHHISVAPENETPARQQSPSIVPNKPLTSHIWIIAGAILIILCMILVFIIKTSEFRLFTMVLWIFFGSAWMIRYALSAEKSLLYGFLAIASLVYIIFYIHPVFKSGRQEKNKRGETVVILLNLFFYYFSVFFLIYKTGHSSYSWVFTLLLLLMILLTGFIADRYKMEIKKLPYLIFILFLVCLLIPLIVKSSTIVLFLASCTVLSMLYSRYKKTQYTLLVSMVSLVLMFMAYLAYWIFVYFQAMFPGTILDHRYIFIKGTWTSAIVLVIVYLEFVFLKHAEISLSRKIFDRSNYRRLLKGMLLLVIYLSVFWIYFYLVTYLLNDKQMRLQVWFSFNCLYLIFATPFLAYQRSFFLKSVVLSGLILNLAYPAVILFRVIELRNNFLLGDAASFRLFLFHYICVVLLMTLLFIQLRFIRRAYPGKKVIIRGFYVYFSLFLIFLLLSEIDHLHILLAFKQSIRIPATLADSRKVPYSIILFISSLVILLTGFIRKSRFLRLYSLILLMVVLAKLLLYDIGSMSNTARTVLFFILGIIMLFISFFYSKIRRFFRKPSEHRVHSGDTSEKK